MLFTIFIIRLDLILYVCLLSLCLKLLYRFFSAIKFAFRSESICGTKSNVRSKDGERGRWFAPLFTSAYLNITGPIPVSWWGQTCHYGLNLFLPGVHQYSTFKYAPNAWMMVSAGFAMPLIIDLSCVSEAAVGFVMLVVFCGVRFVHQGVGLK